MKEYMICRDISKLILGKGITKIGYGFFFVYKEEEKGNSNINLKTIVNNYDKKLEFGKSLFWNNSDSFTIETGLIYFTYQSNQAFDITITKRLKVLNYHL